MMIGTVGTHANNPSLYAKLPYDAVRDFTPLALIANGPVAIIVHPAQPVRTLADLVALAKQMPGKLNYGTAGVGTPGHLTAEMFRAAAGIDIQHVPYKGGAPAITDLIGGQIQIMFEPLQAALANIQGGKVRPLAMSSKVRAPVMPDVPTIAESGYGGFETTAWWGVFAPANCPMRSRRHWWRRSRASPPAMPSARDSSRSASPRSAISAARPSRNSSNASSPNGAKPCGTPT
jgi:tripartite-type tricarboxylate transporter receptor subunit TctC